MSDQWRGEDPPRNLLDYVNGFRHRLYAAGELARDKMERIQGKMKKLYDRRTERQDFWCPGVRVLALLPIIGSLFQAKFSGPHTVIKKLSEDSHPVMPRGHFSSVGEGGGGGWVTCC